MKKRFKFKCWNCGKNYTLFREITDEQTLTVACPYCSEEGIVDLKSYRGGKKMVIRSLSVMPMENEESDLGEELELPDVIPTQKKAK